MSQVADHPDPDRKTDHGVEVTILCLTLVKDGDKNLQEAILAVVKTKLLDGRTVWKVPRNQNDLDPIRMCGRFQKNMT